MDLSLEDYIKFRNYLYEKTGLFFEEQKLYFVKKRLTSRAEKNGIDSISDYIKFLKYIDNDKKEMQILINDLTTNETYFFREFEQLSVFGEVILQESIEKKLKHGQKKIKIWSAACSSGEEPYTLAIILLEMMENIKEWKIEIIGSDINSFVLAMASKGVYSDRSIREVPPEYLSKYFILSSDGYILKPKVKEMVQFENINFIDALTMRHMRDVDFIFCRNALIYFDEESRKKVVGYFYDSLKDGGYIFLGHSESMSRISSAFELKRKREFIVYQKPE